MMNSALIDCHYIFPLSLLDMLGIYGVKQSQLCSYTESKESGEWKCSNGRTALRATPPLGVIMHED